MKATGIIRRVDDLGRVIIPKEIRRQLMIREGDSLEIYVDGERIVYEKYFSAASITDMLKRAQDLIHEEYPRRQTEAIIEKISEAAALLSSLEEDTQ